MLHLTKQGTVRERQLEDEVRRLHAQLAALTGRLEALQAANEGHYRAQYDTTSGPLLDHLFDHQPLLLVGLVLSLPVYAALHLTRGSLSGTGRRSGCFRGLRDAASAVADSGSARTA